jgi:hypothetical protein
MANKILYHTLILCILFSFTIQIELNRESVIEYLKSFLQKKVSNRVILSFIQLVRKLKRDSYPGNYEYNVKNFPKHLSSIKRSNGFIEYQDNYGDLKYGLKTINFSGCEVIAAYNALYDLTGDENINFPDMIDYFEKNGILLYGTFGTAPQAVEEYFDKLGYKTILSGDKKDYYDIQESYDVFILTKFNNVDDIMDLIHTICITKKNGKYHVHNSGYSGYLIEYKSISDILQRIDCGKAKEISLLGIKKK